MAIEKIVNIVVKEDGIDRAIQGADKLGDELRSVEQASDGLSKGMDKSTSSLLDNGGAMGLLNDATGGMAMTVKDAVESMDLFSKGSKVATAATALQTWVTNGANVATKAFRATLLATGIGTVVVLITALVVAMSNMESETEKAEHAQKLLNDEIERSSRLLNEELASIEFVTKARILRAQKGGASEKELSAIEKEGSDQRLAALKKEQEELFKLQGSKDLTPEKAKELNDKILKNTAAFNKELQDQELGRLTNEKDNADKMRALDKETTDKKQALRDKAKEKEREDAKTALAEYKAQLQAMRDAQAAGETEINDAIDAAREQNINGQISAQESELRAVGDKYFRLIEMAKEQGKSTLELEDAQLNERNDINLKYQEIAYENKKKADEREIADAQIVADAKTAIQNMQLDNVSKGISIMQGLGIKNKAIQKTLVIAENAAGIAKIIINTMAANAKAVSASPMTGGMPFVAVNTISGALGVAGSIAATAKALSALGGGGGSSGSGGSMPTTVAPPQFNIVGQSGTNQLAQSIGQQQGRPVEAFVVSGNVTTSQALDRHRQQTATFGG